jgi:hypothetical protein
VPTLINYNHLPVPLWYSPIIESSFFRLLEV